jgi:hypothetical protein
MVAANPGNPGAFLVDRPEWALRVPLQLDELLSSWLIRTALVQGCDPLALTGCVWPDWRVWTLDPDRGIGRGRATRLSALSGIDPDRIEKASLRTFVDRIQSPGSSYPTATWPWVVAFGKRNRRRAGGQPFCPQCLATDNTPYFRRSWRMAWKVVCAHHNSKLVDKCHACKCAIQPHRLVAEDRHLFRCFSCKADLRHAPSATPQSNTGAFVGRADKAFAEGTSDFWGHTLAASEWLASAASLIRWIRIAARRDNSSIAAAFNCLGVDLDNHALPVSGLPFELLNSEERFSLIEQAASLFVAGPDQVTNVLRLSGVAASGLLEKGVTPPTPIRTVLKALPVQRKSRWVPRATSPAKPKTKRAVLGSWARLQRKLAADSG